MASLICWAPAPARYGPDTSTKAATAGHCPAARRQPTRPGSCSSPPPIAAGGPWEPVSDCHALNVSDTCTWTCYDPGFAVIASRDGTRTGWHNDITGVSALAGLGDGRTQLVAGFRVVLPDGQPLPPGTRVTGRGSLLHFSPALTGTSSTPARSLAENPGKARHWAGARPETPGSRYRAGMDLSVWRRIWHE